MTPSGGEYHLLCFDDRVPGDAGPRHVSQQEIAASSPTGFSVEEIREAYLEATFLADPLPGWMARTTRRSPTDQHAPTSETSMSPAPSPARPRRSGGRHPVALVTGANHGIGAAVARALAAVGTRVLVTGLPLDEEPDPAIPRAYYEARARHPETVAEGIRRNGGDAEAVAMDLAEPAAVTALFDAAQAAFDAPVRILVHNATHWVGDTFTGRGHDRIERTASPVSASTLEQQFAVDVRAGALLIAQHATRHQQRDDDWGRIVTLSSGGPDGFPFEASYGAAKAALDNYAMTAAAELGHLGITANAIMPPVTDTGWITPAVHAFVEASWAHHHVATPEEVAGTIAWLCSDDAWLVTGNRLVLR